MWDVILSWMFAVIQFFFNFCHDWGLSIIIVTIIFRIIVWPLMHKQAKSNYKMQKIQPEVAKVQEKFAGDQVRINQEMQKLYAEAKFNPLAGCLPMILQIPIFIALFQVLRDLPRWTTDTNISFYGIIPDLIQTPSGAIQEGFGTFVPYLILMIIFAGATFLPMVLQQMRSNSNQKNQTLIMGAIMSIMMLWISWGSPAGVLLFWGVSSLIGIFQNQFAMHRCRKADAEKEAKEALEVKPVEVDVVRKAKKKKPTKKH